MNYLLKYLFVLIIFLLFTCCTKMQQQEINELISEIRQKYAPDCTIALFDIHVNETGKLAVEGETNITAAFHELDSIIKADFPAVEFKASLLPSESLKDYTWGIITVSVANFRLTPAHDAELVTQSTLGTPVRIFKKEDNWYLVQAPDSYLGWITESSVKPITEEELHQYNNSERIIFTDMTGICYMSPDEKSGPVSDLVPGSILEVVGEIPGFYKADFPDGRTGYVSKNQCLTLEKWKESFTYNPDKIVKTAVNFLGYPYLWGGTSSKGVDCSGLTKTVFFMNGIILQRDASQQVLYGDLVDVSSGYETLEPADLLFFGVHETDSTKESVTHVAIYIGGGEIIHSSGRVKINSIVQGKENYSGYLDSIFICARRVLTCAGNPGIEPVFSNGFYE